MPIDVMATVSTGLLSPNAYGLTQEPAGTDTDYHHHHHRHRTHSHHHHHHHHLAARGGGDVSTDSDPDATYAARHLAAATATKRNKRKNFEPRCTNVDMDASDDDCEQMASVSIVAATTTTTMTTTSSSSSVIPPTATTINNNNNNNKDNHMVGKSRRKTTARKLVYQRPMNLTAAAGSATTGESDSPATISSPDEEDEEVEEEDDDEEQEEDERGVDAEDEEEEEEEEEDEEDEAEEEEREDDDDVDSDAMYAKVSAACDGGGGKATPVAPSDADFQQLAAAAAVTYHAQHALMSAAAAATGGGGGGTVGDMRDYAVHTMRELLAIYGLSADVADSFARHLPMAAVAAAATFTSGQPFEQQATAVGSPTSPSQPPTPPSTPLSPRHNNAPLLSQHLTHLAQLANIPPASPQALLPQGANGGATWLEYPFAPHHHHHQHADQMDTLRNNHRSTMMEEALLSQLPPPPPPPPPSAATSKMMHAVRSLFPHLLNYPHTSETESPPPPPLAPSVGSSALDMSAHQLSAIMSTPTTTSSAALMAAAGGGGGKTRAPIDYTKYVRKFASSAECGGAQCRDAHHREHFHCLDCDARVFVKKEEMIRHFKWHKKRDDSLQHGFMRYSPLDDCTDHHRRRRRDAERHLPAAAGTAPPTCTHNRKQTHYHCIHDGCDKVYISTSDVQMHANYHRKDTAIILEGFQRYRATEACGATYCAFFGQRTTHFHCRRANCRHTFKNKSDMEKHKTYHVKDEQLTRDGFKKFLKHEACAYAACRFSRVCNHIHCIRPACNYVLHSSGQLFSHKRKHERQDTELAYRKYKLAASMAKAISSASSTTDGVSGGGVAALNLALCDTEEEGAVWSPPTNDDEEASVVGVSGEGEAWRAYGVDDECACAYARTAHFHCTSPHCAMTFGGREGMREHARHHRQQEGVAAAWFSALCADSTCASALPPLAGHYHCLWEKCGDVVGVGVGEKPFGRLEHFRMHEYARKLSVSKDTHLATSIDGMFGRKRGRPPKNRVVEVWHEANVGGGVGGGGGGVGGGGAADAPQAIFTSFKLPKPSTSMQQYEEAATDGATTDELPSACVEEDDDGAAMNLSHAGDMTMNAAGKVSVVKASGTFYPLSSAPQNECQSPEAKSISDLQHSNDITGSCTLYGPDHSCSRPFCKLKRKHHYHCNACNQAFSELDRLVVHVAKHSTGALTSGSSQATHLYEDNNNQSPTSPAAPLPTEAKIQVAALQTLQTPGTPTAIKEESLFFQPQQQQQQQFDAYASPFSNLPATLQFALMSQHQHQFLPQSYAALPSHLIFQPQQQQQQQQSPSLLYPDSMSPLAAMAANLGKRSLEEHLVPPTTSEAKKARTHSAMRMLKDEPVPAGYLRFRFNEDCAYTHCGYREHQTHFHCQRPDCGYSFCDKTRFVQHTARHERLDTLMGGDFQQYRANVSCGRVGCVHAAAHLGGAQNKASHFHCLKCDFVCTDTNKVVAHRRQHQKLDSIQAAGFEKFTPSQQCRSGTCQHSGKQTHYHCLQCQYAVLGLAQMSAHKYRHMEG